MESRLSIFPGTLPFPKAISAPEMESERNTYVKLSGWYYLPLIIHCKKCLIDCDALFQMLAGQI